jgi:hypothetical protein
MNRRTLLKLGGIAALAALQPWEAMKRLGVNSEQGLIERLLEWDLPAYAQSNATYQPIPLTGKIIWNGQLNSGLPDLYTTHRMPRLPQFARTSYGGAVIAEWPDATTVPNQAWYELFAAALLADSAALNQCREGWFQFDLETFDLTSQAARLTSAANYVTVYNGIKAVLPHLNFSFYGVPNIRDWFNNTDPVGSAGFAQYQADMADMAAMYGVVPCIFPSLYILWTRQTDGPQTVSFNNTYITHSIQVTYDMIRKHGNGQKVYPFINYTDSADGVTPIDFDQFEQVARLCYQLSDGYVYWGGFGTAWSVESTLPWWTKVVEPMALGRKPGPLLQ